MNMKIKARDRLTQILKDGIDVHRCASARALGDLACGESADALVAALLDEDSDVRADAATALGQLNNPDTAAKLMENLLGDPDPEVKKAVITALVAMRYQPVVPILQKLVTSRASEDVAWDEDDFYASGWDDWVDIQAAAIKGLGEFGTESGVSEIVAAITADDGLDMVGVGIKALAKMGNAGAVAIIDQYGVGDSHMCRQIARAVGASSNPHLDDLRGGMIDDVKPEIRQLALLNLPASDDRLKPLFGDQDAAVRAAVVKHAGAENILLLWDLINDPAPEVRQEVFKIIAANPEKFQDEDLEMAVQKAIAGEPAAAKQAALALIALRGPDAAKGLVHVLSNDEIPKEFRVGVIEAVEKSGNVAVPALLQAAGDSDRQLRLAAMTALAEIASRDAEWPNDAGLGLITALNGELVLPPKEEISEEEPAQEPEEITPEIAAEIDAETPLAAEEVKPDPVVSTLDSIKSNIPDVPDREPEEIILSEEQNRMLDLTKVRKRGKNKVSWETAAAPHQDVQRFSARLLGSVVHAQVTESLLAALERDIDDETRTAVLFSLAKHGEKTGVLPQASLGLFQQLCQHEDSETRMLAVRCLGYMAGAKIDAELEGLLKHSDAHVRVEAVRGLDHRNHAGDPLIDALDDEYQGVGIAAARALARLYGPDAVDALVLFSLTNDGTYRRDIGQLLGRYAPDAGATRLLELLEDEDQKARWLVAIDALAELFQQEAEPEVLKVA